MLGKIRCYLIWEGGGNSKNQNCLEWPGTHFHFGILKIQ